MSDLDDGPATLTDDEVQTHRFGADAAASMDDTGDDSGDTGDASDAADSGDATDTGDDSGDATDPGDVTDPG